MKSFYALPAELLSSCGEFCQDVAFCALRGSNSHSFAATTKSKEQRTKYALTVTLRGRAECPLDAKRAMKKLQRRSVNRFVARAHYYPVSAAYPDQLVAVTFRTARNENVPLMHRAIRQFLRSLPKIPDGHILCESIKFAEEFDGKRDNDLERLVLKLPEQTSAVLQSAVGR